LYIQILEGLQLATLSIAILGAGGLTWSLWKRLVTEIEPLGFAGMYYHGAPPHPYGAYNDSLEMMIALSYLADHSQRVQLGTVVALMPINDPVLLARQAVALDDLSGGRFVLGLGVGGWLGADTPTRVARFDEWLEVIWRLLRTTDPVTFDGKFYQFKDALVLPQTQRVGGPAIMVGVNSPKRMLPLVARYGDVWNAQLLTPEEYGERNTRLDDLLKAEGRQPQDVKRTFNLRVVCARSPAELEPRLSWLRSQIPMLANLPLETLLEVLRTQSGVFVGTPETVVEHIHAFTAVGAEEIIFTWSALDDIEGLRLIAEEVLPNI
jgi:alkanesulfonate monooxygenase SsuD/methylene tetrahydromethanopterin reductase-like flavin-dependent oxidoreductase (luciferase family)